jgi:predicted nucleic acid-binding protein
MATFYCDTSALVKRYAQETGTVWVRNLTNPTEIGDKSPTTNVQFSLT